MHVWENHSETSTNGASIESMSIIKRIEPSPSNPMGAYEHEVRLDSGSVPINLVAPPFPIPYDSDAESSEDYSNRGMSFLQTVDQDTTTSTLVMTDAKMDETMFGNDPLRSETLTDPTRMAEPNSGRFHHSNEESIPEEEQSQDIQSIAHFVSEANFVQLLPQEEALHRLGNVSLDELEKLSDVLFEPGSSNEHGVALIAGKIKCIQKVIQSKIDRSKKLSKLTLIINGTLDQPISVSLYCLNSTMRGEQLLPQIGYNKPSIFPRPGTISFYQIEFQPEHFDSSHLYSFCVKYDGKTTYTCPIFVTSNQNQRWKAFFSSISHSLNITDLDHSIDKSHFLRALNHLVHWAASPEKRLFQASELPQKLTGETASDFIKHNYSKLYTWSLVTPKRNEKKRNSTHSPESAVLRPRKCKRLE